MPTAVPNSPPTELFAAERTYAAWVRTGLVAMASGIGAKALFMDTLPYWLITATGSVFMLFSVFCFGAASGGISIPDRRRQCPMQRDNPACWSSSKLCWHWFR